ncbi:MAG: hypothetical protein DRI92_03185 [Aquificota bacterium]|nr:MAG: hypothetical protein DRI92_03185 [Aquificota bacterium]
MSFSRERIFHLVAKMMEEMEKEDLTLTDPEKLRSRLTKTFSDELRVLETIDQEVRAKISRMSKPIAEGSGEWKALYERFFEEEWKRRLRI